MPQDNLPPLRIRENDGDPNVLPVFDIILSSNLSLQNKGGGVVVISASTGAGGTAQAPITFPLIIGSGGTGIATAGSATSIVGMNSSASVYDFYRLAASDNMTIVRNGTAYLFSATTNAGGSSIVYAATGNKYAVLDLASDLTNEFRLVQSGNSITITTAGNNIIINATTGSGSSPGGSDTYIQVNSQSTFAGYSDFYWDENNFALAVGANTTNQIIIGNNRENPQIVVTASAGQAGIFLLSSDGNEADVVGRGQRGTIIAPASSAPTDTVFLLEARAYDGTNYRSVGGIEFKLDGLVKADSLAACIEFWTNPGLSGDVKAMILDRYKDLRIGRGIWLGSTGGNLVSSSSAGYIYAVNAVNSDTTINFSRATSSRTIFMPDSSGTFAANARYPLLLSSGGNVYLATGAVGQMLITSGGVNDAVWVNTLGGAAGAVYAATGNTYIVTDLASDLTSEFRLVQSGNSITISTAGNLIIINAVTNGAGGGTQTIRIPMALLTVKINSANAFWTAKSGSQVDAGHVQFVDSGVGIATYWAEIPNNINSTENWNVYLKHEPESGAAGNVALTLCGQVLSDGSVIDANTTVLLSARSFPTYAAGTLAVTSMATGVMDNTLGLAANQTFHLIVQRLGNNAGDSVNANWNLKVPTLEFTVNT